MFDFYQHLVKLATHLNMLMLDEKSLLKIQILLPFLSNLRWGAKSQKDIFLSTLCDLIFGGRCSSSNNLLLSLILLYLPGLYPMIPLNWVNIVIYGQVSRLLQTYHVVRVEVVYRLILFLVHDLVAECQFCVFLVEFSLLLDSQFFENLLLHVLCLVKLHPERVLEAEVLLHIIREHISNLSDYTVVIPVTDGVPINAYFIGNVYLPALLDIGDENFSHQFQLQEGRFDEMDAS